MGKDETTMPNGNNLGDGKPDTTAVSWSTGETAPEPEFVYDTARVSFDSNGLKLHFREAADQTAAYAFDLIRTNGILMATPDGEDATGRAKLNVMPPRELVARAFDIAELAFAEARERGHMIEVPTWETIETTITAKREAEDEALEARNREREERRRATRAQFNLNRGQTETTTV
jgi:hypothetical protein